MPASSSPSRGRLLTRRALGAVAAASLLASSVGGCLTEREGEVIAPGATVTFGVTPVVGEDERDRHGGLEVCWELTVAQGERAEVLTHCGREGARHVVTLPCDPEAGGIAPGAAPRDPRPSVAGGVVADLVLTQVTPLPVEGGVYQGWRSACSRPGACATQLACEAGEDAVAELILPLGLAPSQGFVDVAIDLGSAAGVHEFCVDLTVTNPDPIDTVGPSRACSRTHGTGATLTFVTVCQPTAESSAATLGIKLVSAVDAAGAALSDVRLPCGDGLTCQQAFTCQPNSDVEVTLAAP